MNQKRKYFAVLFSILLLLLISVLSFIGYRQYEKITASNSIERLRVCRGHMRKILGAMQLYCLEHEGRLPPATKAGDKYYWVEALAPYIEKLWTISKQNFEQVRQQDKNHYAALFKYDYGEKWQDLLYCPSDKKREYPSSYASEPAWAGREVNKETLYSLDGKPILIIWCENGNHRELHPGYTLDGYLTFKDFFEKQEKGVP